jgi:DNA repair photolyase
MRRPPAPRGRGTADNPANRFDRLALEPDPDPIDPGSETGETVVATEYFRDASRSVISRNESPDIPFEISLNPYRGCEHGCVYCYARPTHEFLGLSAGLDFETRIFVKEDAPDLLREELRRRTWTPQDLVLSGVTDPYQPIERTLLLTRRCLDVLVEYRHPVRVITKSALVARDADRLAALAAHGSAAVALSITTLDEDLRRRLEPRAASPGRRLEAIARLSAAGVPAGVMVAPVIPGLNDHEIPAILGRAADAGACFAGYTMLRLPYAVKDLFAAWIDRHYPERKQRILGRISAMRGGRLNDPHFGTRMRGAGPLADLVADVFRLARERAGIPAAGPRLSADAFRQPSAQRSLFD